MNVLARTLSNYVEIPLKGGKEIKFSPGGHMFIVSLLTQYQLCNFYTGDAPSSLIGKNHNGRVRGIDWFEDDMGFTTVGMDGGCYYHDL